MHCPNALPECVARRYATAVARRRAGHARVSLAPGVTFAAPPRELLRTAGETFVDAAGGGGGGGGGAAAAGGEEGTPHDAGCEPGAVHALVCVVRWHAH